MVFPAHAGFASASAVAPASQNAVLIMVSPSLLPLFRQPDPDRLVFERFPFFFFFLFLSIVCAKSRAGSKHDRLVPFRTFGHAPLP